MKKLSVLLVATAAVALSASAFAEVKIQGKNVQKATVDGAIINVSAAGMTKATQNVSSNKGNVSIQGDNKQVTDVNGAIINVAAAGMARAEQNVSSNEGE